ncbi:MAG: hypothetical protein EA376_09025 [Phycisphaeraceae bacterium]|nr:MAG: hypothetical protein EA376_09025 [Phycisphaeraceae bacterium]
MKSKMRLWLSVSLAAITLASLGLIIGPKHRSLARLNDERLTLAARVADADDGAAAIRRLEESLALARKMARQQTKPIPQDSDFASFMRNLSERLDELQLFDREINTGRELELDLAWSMPMSVTLRGPFTRVHDAIQWIESLQRLVRVQRLRIETDRGRDDKTQLGGVRVEMTLDLFFGADEEMTQALADATGEEDQ